MLNMLGNKYNEWKTICKFATVEPIIFLSASIYMNSNNQASRVGVKKKKNIFGDKMETVFAARE